MLDFDCAIFTPSERPEALTEIAALVDVDLSGGIDEAVLDALTTIIGPDEPETFGDLFTALSRYLTALACLNVAVNQRCHTLEDRVDALTARVAALEAP